MENHNKKMLFGRSTIEAKTLKVVQNSEKLKQIVSFPVRHVQVVAENFLKFRKIDLVP
jgi:hypothetical protein